MHQNAPPVEIEIKANSPQSRIQDLPEVFVERLRLQPSLTRIRISLQRDFIILSFVRIGKYFIGPDNSVKHSPIFRIASGNEVDFRDFSRKVIFFHTDGIMALSLKGI